MHIGWVKIHRSITEHWLYKEKPFCMFGAWIDLLLMANHEDRKFPLGDKIITIKRGQMVTSFRSLSERWGWGMGRVKRFLNLICVDNMISINSTTNGTLLTIVNYDVYQISDTQTERERNANGTLVEHLRNDSGTIAERNKNIKNEKNDKNDKNARSNKASSPPKKKYGSFNNVSLTDEEYNSLCVDYGQDMTEKAIDYLDAYIEEKGYKAKNHNLTLRRWVFKAVQEHGNRSQKPKSLMETWGLTKEDFNT